MTTSDTRIAWFNGQFLPLADVRLSPMDRGFLFADGIYEVTAVLDGKLVDSASHLARLERSAAALEITLRGTFANIESVERELIARNSLDRGTVYIQLTRGVAERDFLGQPDEPTLLIFTQADDMLANPAIETGVAVVTMPDIRWGRRDIKSVMLLAQVLAKRAAYAAGAKEAWLVDDAGFVTEGASSTALIVTADGVLVTRPNSVNILPGCTRAAVLALATRDNVPLEERAFTVAEALSAREAMLTSASTFVLPIVQIDGHAIGTGTPGPIARRLRELYLEMARNSA
jgi:D-alanine transaminase